ncbi:MAG: branched-chain amino acid ABC transporter permease [Microthrixaceae bacterium]|nr:branched-chain amino acid ABC transporter permease [Acidimicrobiales bacterium]MCB9402838.1 branched-chain amino acid ABC transporter permease [Microthrixaceae bacterium]
MAAKIPWLRVAVGVVAAAVAIGLPFNNEAETVQVFSQVLYLAIAAMGLNLLTGFNGQVSIGHGAFFGVGAFTSAILVVDHGWYLEATIPVAALLAAALGVLVGFPALRVKGLYLALVTLGLAVLFPSVVKKFVEGPGGVPLLQPKRSQVASLIPSLADDQYQYFVCLGVMVLLFVLAASLIRSRAGRAMIAVRDQEVAASTVGINVAQVKVASFAISAAYAGIAGSLSVLVNRVADGSNPLIYFQYSIEFLIAVVIGGAATLTGPFLGSALLVGIRKRFEGTEAMAPALLGVALIAAVFLMPDGLVGLYRRLAARVRSSVPSEPSDTAATTVEAAVPINLNKGANQ